jgi:hypothetical protein
MYITSTAKFDPMIKQSSDGLVKSSMAAVRIPKAISVEDCKIVDEG